MKKLIDGERPQRPPKGKRLGLSDKLWEITQSSLAHEAKERPPVGTFAEFLEKATPDIAILEELTEFDMNSEDDIRKLHSIFEYGDNTLFGMRDDETLVAIEVFDRVGSRSTPDTHPPILISLGPRSSLRHLMTKSFAVDVCVDSRRQPPDVDFCRRATGFHTVPSLCLIVISPQRGGYPTPASD